MKLIVTNDYEELSHTGAQIISTVVSTRLEAAVVIATGDTPMGVYGKLVEAQSRGEVDAKRLRVFQLDEYLGVPPDDHRSLYGWMLRSFVQPLGIQEENVTPLPWDARDPEAGIKAYEQAVEALGGFDLAVLGLGPNGHLGFNEPPCGPDAPTRVVELTEESVESNARYWGGRDAVPRKAVTAGMNKLLAARLTLLLVSGAHKRDILYRTVVEPPMPTVPASYLQQAENVVVLADRDEWPHEAISN